MRKLCVQVFFILMAAAGSIAAQNSNITVAKPSMTPYDIPAKSTVRGRVYYTDTGRPVRRATLMLLPSDFSGGPGNGLSAITDSEGNFEFKNVKVGSYYSMINSPGIVTPMAFADWSQMNRASEREVFEGAFSEFEKITVDGLTDIDVQIPARRGGAVSGRVMYADGEAAVGVKVELLRRDGDRFIPVIANFSAIMAIFGGAGGGQTDDRGAYRFAGLPRGEYKLKITENISHSTSNSRGSEDMFFSLIGGGNSLVTVYYPDFMDAAKAQILTVETGSELMDINILIPNHNLHRVGGSVIAAKDKTPVKNASIKLKKKGDDSVSIFNDFKGAEFSAKTDDEGKWYFKELPKGTYEILIEPAENYDYTAVANAMNAASNSMNAASNSAYAGNSYYGSATNNRPNVPKPPKLAKKVQEIIVEDKDISDLAIEMGYGATISGTVSTEDGKDLPDSVIIDAINEIEQATSAGGVHNSSFEGGPPTAVRPSGTFKIESVAAGKTTFRVRISDDDYYVKSALAGGKDLLTGTFTLKDGEALANIQIVISKNTGTLKGTVVDSEKEPVPNVQFTLIPTDALKRKITSFYQSFNSDEEGVYVTKAAPGDYAVVFNMKKKLMSKPSGDYDKWLDDLIRSSVTITLKAGETTTQKLTVPKK